MLRLEHTGQQLRAGEQRKVCTDTHRLLACGRHDSCLAKAAGGGSLNVKYSHERHTILISKNTGKTSSIYWQSIKTTIIIIPGLISVTDIECVYLHMHRYYNNLQIYFCISARLKKKRATRYQLSQDSWSVWWYHSVSFPCSSLRNLQIT